MQGVLGNALFPACANGTKSLIFVQRERLPQICSPLRSVGGTIIIIASDSLAVLHICLTLTKCHYLLQHEFTQGFLEKKKICAETITFPPREMRS